MKFDDSLSSSLEDYLEAIFNIIQEKQAVRVKDLAKRLKVKASSVTGALKQLAEKGMINYAPYDVITMTQAGTVSARNIVNRHKALMDFFSKVLLVDKKLAEAAACKMEHELPVKIMDKITRFMRFLEECPRGGMDWIEMFNKYCVSGRERDTCEPCMENCRKRFQQSRTK